jgi:addiction module HigA family antidote
MQSLRNKNRKPTSPGEILNEEFLLPLNLKQTKLAKLLDCDVKVINRLVNEQSSLSVHMAIKLAAVFNTTPEFWLNAQRAIDLFEASKEIKTLPKPFLKTGT